MRRGVAFLTRAAELERKINTAVRKLELCKSMTQRITPSLSSDRVSHTRNVTANEDAIIRLIEAEEEIRRLTSQYEEIVSEISAVLSSMENPLDEKLLADHYLKHVSFEAMAAKEHVTRDCMYKRHSRALDELETLLVP